MRQREERKGERERREERRALSALNEREREGEKRREAQGAGM